MSIMDPRKASPLLWVILVFFLAISLCGVKVLSEEHHAKPHEGPFVERDQWRTLVVTEFGEITAIDVKEGPKELPYHLQFFILEPNSLFLPVLLHADMVFYVHTGSGRLTWANDDGTSTIPLREGDVCSVNEGSVFYIQSNLEAERRKLRIYAMFTNTDDNTFDPSIGAYSRINELVKGFDKKIMQAALKVPEDLIDAIINKSNTPAIVHAVPEKRNIVQELEATILKSFLGFGGSNSKKLETYNIFDHDPDFKNPNGWSTAVTKTQLKSLKRTNIGFLMVNLTKGSILGPHWNPKAAELAVGVDGGGMVRVLCGSGNEDETECKNMRFKVKKGDAFVVPRFHPMAQMSFNDGPFVFLGFSTSAKKNHPQFLAGKGSVLHILDKQILATSFGVSNKTIEQLLSSPDDSIIFGCSSCAEEEEKIMKEEEEKRKREEEEEKRKREEEEEKRKREEEEEKRKREEEEEKKREEEEEKKREEEEERRKEEEEEEKKKKEEEEKRRRQEEEEARKKEEERKREEEEARRQQEEREKKREEEEAKREEEEREREREEEEEARREREWRRKREEAAARREAEQAAQRARQQARREAAQRAREQARREAEQRKKEQARREHERREDEDEPAWWKRIREEKGKRPEQEIEPDQEEAMRQQEEREKRRDPDSDRRIERAKL